MRTNKVLAGALLAACAFTIMTAIACANTIEELLHTGKYPQSLASRENNTRGRMLTVWMHFDGSSTLILDQGSHDDATAVLGRPVLVSSVQVIRARKIGQEAVPLANTVGPGAITDVFRSPHIGSVYMKSTHCGICELHSNSSTVLPMGAINAHSSVNIGSARF